MNREYGWVFIAPLFMLGIIIFSSCELRNVVDSSMLMTTLPIKADLTLLEFLFLQHRWRF